MWLNTGQMIHRSSVASGDVGGEKHLWYPGIRSSVTLDPNAHTPGQGAAPSDPAAKDGESVSETAALGEGILMVLPVNSKTQGGGGARDHTAKGYLELGGKGSGGEGEAQTSREGGEEEEDEEGDVEELINFLDSEGSLHSELLD
ncbi:unnamed protein product [Gadus morhua 'NCC']